MNNLEKLERVLAQLKEANLIHGDLILMSTGWATEIGGVIQVPSVDFASEAELRRILCERFERIVLIFRDSGLWIAEMPALSLTGDYEEGKSSNIRASFTVTVPLGHLHQ